MTLVLRRLLLLLLLLLTALPLGAAELRVAVTANFLPVLQQLAPRFEAESGVRLRISPGASGALYAQIVNGAPFDVFLSADTERPERLVSDGHALPGSLVPYARGVLVLWSPQPGRVDAEGAVLHRGDFRHLALAEPRLAPYGAAARDVLEAVGVYATLEREGRLVRGQSISQTHAHVASGAAELGFVALSQVRDGAGRIAGSYWLPPQDSYTPIRQAAVVLARAREPERAAAFLAWLGGDAARAAIRAAGYALD